jgi:Holliday junction resolvasome RuvABC DNA-binding subunit
MPQHDILNYKWLNLQKAHQNIALNAKIPVIKNKRAERLILILNQLKLNVQRSFKHQYHQLSMHSDIEETQMTKSTAVVDPGRDGTGSPGHRF